MNKQEKHMMMEDDLNLGSGHIMKYTDHVS